MVTLQSYQKYLDLTPEQFQEYQFRKVKKFVKSIKRQSKYYRKKLKNFHSVNSYKDFEKLPILEQAELRTIPLEDFRACPWSQMRTVSGSSGTTGDAKTVLWTEESLREECKWNALEYLMMGVTQKSRFALVMSIGMSRCLGIVDACRNTGAFVIPVGRINNDIEMDLVIEKMKSLKVTHIHGVTSRLITLTKRAREIGYDLKKDFSLKSIIGGSMVTSDASREYLEKEWGAMYFDAYGANEASFIAGECKKHNGLHVFPGINYVEVVDPVTHKQIRDNKTIGEILVTNVSNLGTPLLRYRVGDVGTITYELCRCGVSFPRIYIKGRSLFMLTIDGTKIHAYDVDAILSGFSGFTNMYRAEVMKSGKVYSILFKIESMNPGEIKPSEVRLLIKKLEEISAVFHEKVQAGWVSIKVDVVPFGSLERSGRDKIKNQVVYQN